MSSDREYTPELIRHLKDDVNLQVVLEELKKNIEEQLKKCGLYYRLFMRVKDNESLALKLGSGEYGCGEYDKKVQDLLGIRVVLYYSDDLSACRYILEKTFNRNGQWSQNEMTVNQFQATKINGVFEIPQKLLEMVDEHTWKLPVDATFEVQLRTVLFEGWHEIEHDMRYKDIKNHKKNLWDDNEALARTMNSILASLELCDWSLSSLFQSLARKHLEKKNWELMFRSRYRLRLDEKPLRSEVVEYLNEHEQLGNQFFNCDKVQLVSALMDENVHTKLTYDVLVKVLNMLYVKDETIQRLLADTKLKVYEPVPHKNKFKPLENRTTFQLDVALNDENTPQGEVEDNFHKAVQIIYSWGRYKYREIFPEMKEEPEDFKGTKPGYELHVEYDEETQRFLLNCSRIDATMPGTLWFTETCLENKNGRLLFFCVTTSSAPEQEIAKISFRKPKFVDRIRDEVDFYDVEKLPSRVSVLENEGDAEKIRTLLEHPARCLPVVVIGWDAEDGKFLLNPDKLLATIGSFAHVYAQKASKDGSVMIFWPDGSYVSFDRETIKNCRFDYNRKVFADEDIYEIPFRHRVVNLVRERNNGIIREE